MGQSAAIEGPIQHFCGPVVKFSDFPGRSQRPRASGLCSRGPAAARAALSYRLGQSGWRITAPSTFLGRPNS
eukprot:2532292-Lingulodinium_polyedra.AAC.1